MYVYNIIYRTYIVKLFSKSTNCTWNTLYYLSFHPTIKLLLLACTCNTRYSFLQWVHFFPLSKNLIQGNCITNYRCLWINNAPLPQLNENRLDLDISPTDLDIDRGHLLTKDYLPTKFEDSGAKRSRVISCTRCGRLTLPLTLTLDLLTWISIGIIYSSRTIYLLSLNLLGQCVLEISIAQGVGDWHDLWPWHLT